jgi:hypothetical protein
MCFALQLSNSIIPLFLCRSVLGRSISVEKTQWLAETGNGKVDADGKCMPLPLQGRGVSVFAMG